MSYIEVGDTILLEGSKSIITMGKPKSLYAIPDNTPKAFTINGQKKEYRGVVYWGTDNLLPEDILDYIYTNPIISSAMEFKSMLAFGDGIIPCRREMDGTVKPYYGYKEVNQFLEDNDINGYLLESITDLQVFYNVFPEIILNNEARPKIVELNHKEATFSRLESMNDAGEIETHFYSAQWSVNPTNPTDIVATPILSNRNPIKDLKYKLGLEKDPMNKVKPTKDRRFIIPLNFPSPGRFYYRKPYWISIIESGWYDFAQQIPEFKKALLTNGMVIKYHVELHPQFWDKFYQKAKANTEAEKKAAKTTWITNLNTFLANPENAGKTFISEKIQMAQELQSMITITPLTNEFKGGEYLGDLEEVSNILSYGMGVHPSLIGSSPGKNKQINGTEARELFIIKQALLKPFRDRLLFPLYLIKAINGWPEDLHFTIANLELTTLDKGTGAEKTISQPAIENIE
jgi:hypothetical protein